MSTIYLAGRLDSGEATISQFAAELEASGHEVLEKWWLQGRLPTPYLEHEESAPAATAMIEAAAGCEIFVLFPADSILGAAIEFGAALASSLDSLDKRIFIVAPHSVRQSVFYAHPNVMPLQNLDELRELLIR